MSSVHTYAGTGSVSDPLWDHRFAWPSTQLADDGRWSPSACGEYLSRVMPESGDEFAVDSQWPAFFPSPICVISASDGQRTALEREVGASIVNRFPYVLTVSVCRDALSGRHHPRSRFIDVLTSRGSAAVQFVEPGPDLNAALEVIAELPENALDRIERTISHATRNHKRRAGILQRIPRLHATLIKPQRNSDSTPIYAQP